MPSLRLATIDRDGWQLDSAEARHAANPATFWIPPRPEREALRPGQAAKLLFRGREANQPGGTERMWVIVARRAGDLFVGVLENTPAADGDLTTLARGQEVVFAAEHVADIDTPPREHVLRRLGGSAGGGALPDPPFLLVREAVSFGVQQVPVEQLTATRQAFAEGCFQNAWCYDGTGRLWRIRQASLVSPPATLDALRPWRRVPAILALGPPEPALVGEVAWHLVRVLASGNEFAERLGEVTDLVTAARRLEQCTRPHDLIAEAARLTGESHR